MLELRLREKRQGSFSLKDVRLSLPDKGLFMLRGPNGSGKSTLLAILSGRDDLYEGSLSWNRKDVKEERRSLYVTHIAQFLPQIPLVFEDLNVVDNILAPYRDRDREKALSLVDRMGLGKVANSLASSLSSGEKARVAFARALYGDHPVILLDEVTASLDPRSASILREQVLSLAKERLVIFATHEEEDILPGATILDVRDGLSYEGEGISSSDSREKSTDTVFKWSSLLKDWDKTVVWTNLVLSFLLSLVCFVFGGLGAMAGSNYGNMGDRESPEEEVIAQYFLANAPGVFVDLNSPLFGEGLPVLYPEWLKDDAGGRYMGAFLFDWEKLSPYLGEDWSLLHGRLPENSTECLVPENYLVRVQELHGGIGEEEAFALISEKEIPLNGSSLRPVGVYPSLNTPYYLSHKGLAVELGMGNSMVLEIENSFLSDSLFVGGENDGNHTCEMIPFPKDVLPEQVSRGSFPSGSDVGKYLVAEDGSAPLAIPFAGPRGYSAFSLVFAFFLPAYLIVLSFVSHSRDRRRNLLLLAGGADRGFLAKEQSLAFLLPSLLGYMSALILSALGMWGYAMYVGSALNIGILTFLDPWSILSLPLLLLGLLIHEYVLRRISLPENASLVLEELKRR